MMAKALNIQRSDVIRDLPSECPLLQKEYLKVWYYVCFSKKHFQQGRIYFFKYITMVLLKMHHIH